jgi:hypothetical protein
MRPRIGQIQSAAGANGHPEVRSGHTARVKISKARSGLRTRLALPDRVRSLDAELDERLTKLGMTGFHEIELEDGGVFRVPEFFEAMIASLKR